MLRKTLIRFVNIDFISLFQLKSSNVKEILHNKTKFSSFIKYSPHLLGIRQYYNLKHLVSLSTSLGYQRSILTIHLFFINDSLIFLTFSRFNLLYAMLIYCSLFFYFFYHILFTLP